MTLCPTKPNHAQPNKIPNIYNLQNVTKLNNKRCGPKVAEI